MKRFLKVALVVAAVLVLAGEGFAQMAGPMYGPMYGRMGAGMGPGMMGGGMMGRGMMGGQADAWNCPGLAAASGATESGAITEEKAKELAQQYADRYLKGFTVERVLPFTGMRGDDVLRRVEGTRGAGADLPHQSLGERDAVRWPGTPSRLVVVLFATPADFRSRGSSASVSERVLRYKLKKYGLSGGS